VPGGRAGPIARRTLIGKESTIPFSDKRLPFLDSALSADSKNYIMH